MRRLAWAFAVRLCDKYPFLTSHLILLNLFAENERTRNPEVSGRRQPKIGQACTMWWWRVQCHVELLGIWVRIAVNIGIKHASLIHKHLLGPSLGAQQMLMYQRSMFDRYYCIKKTWILWRKCFEKFFFPVPIMTRKVICFENATSRAKAKVILTSQNYVCICACYLWWRQFLSRPRNANT